MLTSHWGWLAIPLKLTIFQQRSIYNSFPADVLFTIMVTKTYSRHIVTSRYLPNLHYTSDYRTRLAKLPLLPLMYVYELNNLIFLIISLKQPSPSVDITNWVKFYSSVTTHLKLVHTRTKCNLSRYFYFER